MWSILSVTLPVFGIIGVGFCLGRLGFLGQEAANGLSQYVFAAALPALIIKTLTASNLPSGNPWGYWLAYFGGVFVVWTLGMWAARRWFGRSRPEAAIHGFTAGQSNTILVGMPIILQAYGQAGAVPLFLLVAVHLPIMMTTATALIESSTPGGHWRETAWRLSVTMLSHPIVISLGIGVVAKELGYIPTGAVKDVIDSLAATAIPCALVGLGLALMRYGFAGDFSAAAVLGVLKLVLHPFLVWVLAFHVFPVPRVWAGVAVLFAAMPTGINCHILATRYRLAEATTSTATALTTAMAVFTVSFWLFVLGV